MCARTHKNCRAQLDGVLYNDGHALVLNCSAAYATLVDSDDNSSDEDVADSVAAQPNSDSNNNNNNRTQRATISRRATQPDESSDGRSHLLNDLATLFDSPAKADSVQAPNQIGELANAIQSHQQLEDNMVRQQIDASPRVDAAPVHLSGAGLAYSYRFELLFMRFGSDANEAGSEHRIDSRAFAAELQLFAYNSALYRSYAEASVRPHGLLGVSILVDVLPDDKSSATQTLHSTNSQLDALLSLATQSGALSHRGAWTRMRAFNVSALVPERERLVAYAGSLTTPGCHESVDWLLLNKPLHVTQSSVSIECAHSHLHILRLVSTLSSLSSLTVSMRTWRKLTHTHTLHAAINY